MADVPTQEELDELAAENDNLREQIAEAHSRRAELEAERARELRGAELYAEHVRLQAQLAQATAAAEVGVVQGGTDTLLANAIEQVKAAEAVAEQPVGPVDTNADVPPEPDQPGDDNTNGGSL